MFLVDSSVALLFDIPIKSVMSNYFYDVLVILIVMELFTNLIAETGIMQLLAIKIAEMSKGKKHLCLVMFGGMMFLISSCLNNITAVMMILPIVFVLLKTLEVDKKYVCTFFAVILALTFAVLLTVWGLYVKKENDDSALRKLAVTNLKSQYKNIEIRFDVLKLLAVVL